MDRPLPVYVSAQALRRLCNEARILERATAGDLGEDIVSSSHLSRMAARRAGQRYCTSSQSVVNSDWLGNLVALCHWYIHEGRIGGSGRPDPKLVVVAGRQYRIERP